MVARPQRRVLARCDPPELTLPVIQDPLYGYEAVNVEAQERDQHSLLNRSSGMLAVRREHPAFGRGTPAVPAPRQPQDPGLRPRA